MKSNTTKIWAIIASSLLAYTGMAHAEYGSSNKPMPPGKKTAANANAKSNEKVINPAVRPVITNGLDFFIEGDLLWWKAREDGLSFATNTSSTQFTLNNNDPSVYNNNNPNQLSPSFSSTLENPSFHAEFGVRAGLGFNLPYDGWDISAYWTHLTSNSHQNTVTADASKNERIIPEYQSIKLPDEFITYTSATPNWKNHFNVLDVELGREFFVSRKLTVRPFVGIRGAWIHQKYTVSANGATGPNQAPVSFKDNTGTEFSSNNLVLNSQSVMKSDFDGAGPRLGFDTEWSLGAGFSIYGQAAASLMLGEFTPNFNNNTLITYNNVDGETLTPSNTNTSTNDASFHNTTAATDLGLGFRWARTFASDSFGLCIDLGWEQHIFFNQNQFIVTTNTINPSYTPTGGPVNLATLSSLGTYKKSSGDLAYSGLTLAIRFDF